MLNTLNLNKLKGVSVTSSNFKTGGTELEI